MRLTKPAFWILWTLLCVLLGTSGCRSLRHHFEPEPQTSSRDFSTDATPAPGAVAGDAPGNALGTAAPAVDATLPTPPGAAGALTPAGTYAPSWTGITGPLLPGHDTPLTPGQQRRAARQATRNTVRILKAQAYLAAAQQPPAPKKMGDGAVWAPNNRGDLHNANASGDQAAAGTDDAKPMAAPKKVDQLTQQNGDGNTATQVKPAAPPWYAFLLTPLGITGSVLVACIVVGLLWPRRRNSSTPPTA